MPRQGWARHRILNSDFGDLDPAAQPFSLAVDNVPFADIRFHDPIYNPDQNLGLHNWFMRGRPHVPGARTQSPLNSSDTIGELLNATKDPTARDDAVLLRIFL